VCHMRRRIHVSYEAEDTCVSMHTHLYMYQKTGGNTFNKETFNAYLIK
jgi:hypothetical protein